MGKVLDAQKVGNALIFKIKVQPGAAKNEIVGVRGDALKIKINAPPVKGKTNKALMDFLAEKLRANKSAREIISGQIGRPKKIKVLGETSTIRKPPI